MVCGMKSNREREGKRGKKEGKRGKEREEMHTN
jgi:hypothetical protein